MLPEIAILVRANITVAAGQEATVISLDNNKVLMLNFGDNFGLSNLLDS